MDARTRQYAARVGAAALMALPVAGSAADSPDGLGHALAKLGVPRDQFGTAVAIDGDTALVGAPNEDTEAGDDAGAVYVFERRGSRWVYAERLVAPGGSAGDRFGNAVALDGDRAVIGAPEDDTARGTNAGSAYVFERNAGRFQPGVVLSNAPGGAESLFGFAVAIEGDTALVGAPYTDFRNVDSGGAFVFVRGPAGWSQQAFLIPRASVMDDFFGSAVAISGETALIGTPGDNAVPLFNTGSAYAFVRSGTTWTEQAELELTERATFDELGFSVAIEGDVAVLGAPGDDTSAGTDTGAAHVFRRAGASWTREATLLPSMSSAGSRFGESLALAGDTVLVGASGDDASGAANAGAAYVFVRDAAGWSLQARLLDGAGRAEDRFGHAVAASGDAAIAGARFVDAAAGPDVGAAFAFVRAGGTWSNALAFDPASVAADYTGAWFDPMQSGHGLFVEHLADDRIAASWYTFAPDGRQAWTVGVGTLAGNAATLSMVQPANGRFPPAFDPGEVSVVPFGEMTLRFDDCDTGLVSFAFPAPYGTGTMPLARPELPAGIACASAAGDPPARGASKATGPLAGLTGSWANPAQPGYGFQVEVLDGDRLVIAWYVFSPVREQLWLIGAGPITGQAATVAMVQPEGGRFVPNFDPTRIVARGVGSLTITALSCTTARVDYAFDAPLGTGSIEVSRVTSVPGVPCMP